MENPRRIKQSYLSPRLAAQIAGVHLRTVQRAIDQGEIPVIEIKAPKGPAALGILDSDVSKWRKASGYA